MQAPARAGAGRGAAGRPAAAAARARGAALRAGSAATPVGSGASTEAGGAPPAKAAAENNKPAKTSTTPVRALTTQGRSPTRVVPKGGPGTATARKNAGLDPEYSKNIIPQGSFWRDGRKGGKREPFKKKWAWLSNGMRRACGDQSVGKGKGSGNWLKAPPAPPPPSDRIGNRKTPTAKQRRAVNPDDMGWYSYLALKPVLPKGKGSEQMEEMGMWNILARDGRRGTGRKGAKRLGNPAQKAAVSDKSRNKARSWEAERSKAPQFKGAAEGLADQKQYDW